MSLIDDGARIDALEYLGDGVVVCATRSGASSGLIYRSEDYGETWSLTETLAGMGGVATIKSAGGGVAYLVGRDGYFSKSTDYGETWSTPVVISTATPLLDSRTQRLYGLHVMPSGTVLAADTAGHILRSTDGGDNWTDLGLVADGLSLTDHAFYRFEETSDGVVLNGWGGWLLKSTWAQDGAVWSQSAVLTSEGTLVAAPAYLGDGIGLQGDNTGVIYRTEDDWSTHTEYATGIYCDDFHHLGNGVVMMSRVATTGNRVLWSASYGKYWFEADVPLDSGDRVDHNIAIMLEDRTISLASTIQGRMMRSELIW